MGGYFAQFCKCIVPGTYKHKELAMNPPELEEYYEDLPLLIRVNRLWPNEDIFLTYVWDNDAEPDWWSEGSAMNFWKGFAKGFLASWRELKAAA